jgi:hypothetical protein
LREQDWIFNAGQKRISSSSAIADRPLHHIDISTSPSHNSSRFDHPEVSIENPRPGR